MCCVTGGAERVGLMHLELAGVSQHQLEMAMLFLQWPNLEIHL